MNGGCSIEMIIGRQLGLSPVVILMKPLFSGSGCQIGIDILTIIRTEPTLPGTDHIDED